MKLPRIQAAQFHWQRTQDSNPQAWRQVQDLVAQVRQEQDEALRVYTQQFDGIAVGVEGFRVPNKQLHDAWEQLPLELMEALQRAATRIRRFHEEQRPEDFVLSGESGEILGMTWRPLRRVGVYAPGGTAAYPSTVLMNVIPAQVAGVTEIALSSPPQRDTGWPHPLVLAAAYLTGVTEVYRLGGAQAVAAMAYGTPTLPRVDKVVGPGNLYVALAKRAVMGDVGIDSIAGPSEVFIVADETADPRYIAADMLAQAEHDPEAGAVCILLKSSLADAVEAELITQLAALPRRETAAAALARWGALVLAETLAEALAVVNDSAPEHVELLIADPQEALAGVRCAGAVFLGPVTPEPVGDYYAGPNHVLPTHGSARFASGLGVLDFMRRMTHVSYTPATLRAHAADIIALAEAEGLSAHARSVTVRLQNAAPKVEENSLSLLQATNEGSGAQ